MKLNSRRLNSRVIEAPLRAWPRVIHIDHRKTPCDTGFGSSRFSSPSKAYRVLYAGVDFATAFSEAIIRDRFIGKSIKYLYLPFLEKRLATEISSSTNLRLLDFTGSAAHDLGVDTDAKGARSHGKGQEFGEALHSQTDLDGLVFASRLTGRNCVAIFDRAFAKLTAAAPREIIKLKEFWNEVDRQEIVVRRKRGLGIGR